MQKKEQNIFKQIRANTDETYKILNYLTIGLEKNVNSYVDQVLLKKERIKQINLQIDELERKTDSEEENLNLFKEETLKGLYDETKDIEQLISKEKNEYVNSFIEKINSLSNILEIDYLNLINLYKERAELAENNKINQQLETTLKIEETCEKGTTNIVEIKITMFIDKSYFLLTNGTHKKFYSDRVLEYLMLEIIKQKYEISQQLTKAPNKEIELKIKRLEFKNAIGIARNDKTEEILINGLQELSNLKIQKLQNYNKTLENYNIINSFEYSQINNTCTINLNNDFVKHVLQRNLISVFSNIELLSHNENTRAIARLISLKINTYKRARQKQLLKIYFSQLYGAMYGLNAEMEDTNNFLQELITLIKDSVFVDKREDLNKVRTEKRKLTNALKEIEEEITTEEILIKEKIPPKAKYKNFYMWLTNSYIEIKTPKEITKNETLDQTKNEKIKNNAMNESSEKEETDQEDTADLSNFFKNIIL